MLDALNVIDLRESPEAFENVIVEQQRSDDPDVAALLHAIFLKADRAAEFQRFERTREFAAIKRLLAHFSVGAKSKLVEIGGGPGFLAWSLARAGYDVDLLEPNTQWNTGSGYLDSLKAIKSFSDYRSWHTDAAKYDVAITKNCIHHFQNISLAAVAIRQKLSAGALWFAFREWFVDSPRELDSLMSQHPYCQKFSLYEWPYPAHHYVESIELAGFEMLAVVPYGYDNNCIGEYSEIEPSARVKRNTERLDRKLEKTPRWFWQEVKRNRFAGRRLRLYTRPQAMIFRKTSD